MSDYTEYRDQILKNNPEPEAESDESDENYDDMWDNADYCYECTGYGDDYYEDENGDLVCACDDCPFNGLEDEDDE